MVFLVAVRLKDDKINTMLQIILIFYKIFENFNFNSHKF